MSNDTLGSLVLNETAFLLLTEEERFLALRDYAIKQGEVLQENMDNFFLIIMGMVVFFMQAGFALLEAGSVRVKNTTNILIKNFLDVCFAAAFWYAIGWGLAFGTDPLSPNPFFGTTEFFLNGATQYPLFFFEFVFAATAATIVSGALAERTDFRSYIMYSCMITAFIYSIVAHWIWDPAGWLNKLGYIDFAGSSVVHVVGGTASLVGAVVVGPRIGRFNQDGSANDIPGHSTVLVAQGGLILWFGFYGFNAGSALKISESLMVGRVVVNTTLAGAFGSISTLVLAKLVYKKYSLVQTVNGALAGMVAICAGAFAVLPWGASAIGAFAGLFYIGSTKLVVKLKIDDPLDAISVHMVSGIWGTIAAPLFTAIARDQGLFMTGHFYSLGINVGGVLVVFFWTAVMSLIMFMPMKLTGVLRIPADQELAGVDTTKHHEPAYPYSPSSPVASKQASFRLESTAGSMRALSITDLPTSLRRISEEKNISDENLNRQQSQQSQQHLAPQQPPIEMIDQIQSQGP